MAIINGVEVCVNKDLYFQFPNLNQRQVAERFVYTPWQIPFSSLDINIPQMGTTGHKGMSSALSFPECRTRFFTKPFDIDFLQQARTERDNIIAARRIGINTPNWIGLLESKDWAVLLTELKQNAVPLSSEDLTLGSLDKRYYSPKDLLNECASFIAFFHNSGLAHGDLHLGNIGFEYLAESRRNFVLFDLELATILPAYITKARSSGYLNEEFRSRVIPFEKRTIDDLYLFCRGLHQSNFPMDYNDIASYVLARYYRLRNATEQWGVPSLESLEHDLLTLRKN